MKGFVSPINAGNLRHQKSQTLWTYDIQPKPESRHYKVPSSDVLVDPTGNWQQKIDVVK